MKPFLKFAFAICIIAFIFPSCNRSNEEGKMIPKTAMFVAQINTKSLGEKLSWDDVKQTQWFKEAYSDDAAKEWMKKILDNPENSGIDFKKSLVFFADKHAGADVNMVVEGSIKNEKDFEQFNKNIDSTATSKKEDGINLLILKDKSVVGWNSKYFAYVISSKLPTAAEIRNWNDSTLNPANSAIENSAELIATCKNLFSLKPDNNLEKNERFGDLLKENGDLHFWQNTEEVMKNSSTLGMLGMLKLDVFFKDNISTYTVNFDKGKINVNQKQYAGKELTDVLKKYKGDKINADMIKNIPSQNVSGIIAMNFKPEGIKELIKLTGMDGFINSYSQQMGFTLDDFVKANNGNLMLAFSDFKIKPDSTGTGKFTRPDFNVLFSVGIGDKTSFQKLIDAGKKLSAQMGGDSMVNYAMNDQIFAISNSNAFANQYLSGANNKYDFMDKISGHPIGLFIDIRKILTEFVNEKSNSDEKAMMDQSLKFWNNITTTGGDFKDGGFTATTTINLADQNTNSLRQLNNYIDEIAKIEKTKKKRNAPESNLDSLLLPPPIDTIKVK